MKYLGIFFSLLLFSCQTNTDKTDQEQTKTSKKKSSFPKVNDEFTLYLDNFKKLDLPIVIKGCNISTDGFKQFDGKQFAKYSEEYSLAYGQVPTNGNYVATITLGAADCYLPVLTTYKLTGQIIDKQTIAIGYCGSDCGYSCEEFMKITNDFKIYTSDTISTYTCDSLGNETPGTYEYYVIFKEGKLLTNGQIQLSDEIKKPLKGRKNEP